MEALQEGDRVQGIERRVRSSLGEDRLGREWTEVWNIRVFHSAEE